MRRRSQSRLLLITTGVMAKLLKNIVAIMMKIPRIAKQPVLRRPILISSGILGITAIITVSITGLFNYTPSTSPAFPYIPPPAGERQRYYLEITPEALWNEFLSPYSDHFTAETKYIGQSFIFKNILIDESKIKWRYDTYIIINQIQFVPRNPFILQNLKEGDRVDIIGVCVGLSEKYTWIVVGNCQFIPTDSAPLPLPGGPAPISPSY